MQGPTSLFHARDRLQGTHPRPRFHTPRHAYLFLQPVVVLHDASHDDIRSLHVKRNLPSRFILEGGPGGMNTQEEHLRSAPVAASHERCCTKCTQWTPVFSHLAEDEK